MRIIALWWVIVIAAACSNGSGGSGEPDSGGPTGADTDVDGDADSDADADGDTDSDSADYPPTTWYACCPIARAMYPPLELDVCEYRRREPEQTLLHAVLRKEYHISDSIRHLVHQYPLLWNSVPP